MWRISFPEPTALILSSDSTPILKSAGHSIWHSTLHNLMGIRAAYTVLTKALCLWHTCVHTK